MNDLNGNIIIYQTEDGSTKINVKIEDETVWLSQQQMAELFSTSRTNIIEHINNIYSEEELLKITLVIDYLKYTGENNICYSRDNLYDIVADAIGILQSVHPEPIPCDINYAIQR